MRCFLLRVGEVIRAAWRTVAHVRTREPSRQSTQLCAPHPTPPGSADSVRCTRQGGSYIPATVSRQGLTLHVLCSGIPKVVPVEHSPRDTTLACRTQHDLKNVVFPSSGYCLHGGNLWIRVCVDAVLGPSWVALTCFRGASRGHGNRTQLSNFFLVPLPAPSCLGKKLA